MRRVRTRHPYEVLTRRGAAVGRPLLTQATPDSPPERSEEGAEWHVRATPMGAFAVAALVAASLALAFTAGRRMAAAPTDVQDNAAEQSGLPYASFDELQVDAGAR